MPGEEEFIAARRAMRVVPTPPAVTARPANDNSPAQATVASPAPTAVVAHEVSKAEATAEPLIKPSKSKVPGQAFAPRIPMNSPSAKIKVDMETADAFDDYIRLFLNGVSGNTSDELQASVDAFLDMLKGTAGFDVAFAERLKQQHELSNAARERRGTTGALVEMAPNFIPGVGDVSGLVADFKDYLENGGEWTAADFAMVAAGLVPGAPNRRTLKSGKKVAENLLHPDAVAGTATQQIKKVAGKIRTAADLIPAPNTKLYTQGQALKLNDEPLGLIFVQEKWAEQVTKKTKKVSEKNIAARKNQEKAPNQLYDSETHNLYAPTLRFSNPTGDNFIRFDGYEVSDQGDVLLIDRKSNLTDFKMIQQSYVATLRRVEDALEQNNKNANGGATFKVAYDFDNEVDARKFEKFVRQNGFSDVVTIRVRESYE